MVAVIFMFAAESPAIANPLIEAAKSGDMEKVQALLAEGAEVNAKGSERGVTALMLAVARVHTDTVKVLLAKGADVNAKLTDGTTALILAEKKGQKELVRILKEAGAKE